VPNALVVSFSITGTTRTAAERVARGLGRAGFAVDLTALEPRSGALPGIPADVDLLAVGSPTHYFRLPACVSSWVAGLPRLDGVGVLSFVLHGSYVGGAGNQLRGLLRARGASEAGYRRLQGAGSYLPYVRRGYRFSAGHPDGGELDGLEAWAGRAARGLEARPGPDGPTHWMYALERAMFWPPLVPRVWARWFSADPQRCDGCGVCVRKCPTGNVTQAERRARPDWGRDCLLCLECALRCPVDAVRTAADWPVFRPFVTYNVRRAAADPELDAVRVRVERGRVVELR
jgi:ferredoxin/flavodoxin